MSKILKNPLDITNHKKDRTTIIPTEKGRTNYNIPSYTFLSQSYNHVGVTFFFLVKNAPRNIKEHTTIILQPYHGHWERVHNQNKQLNNLLGITFFNFKNVSRKFVPTHSHETYPCQKTINIPLAKNIEAYYILNKIKISVYFWNYVPATKCFTLKFASRVFKMTLGLKHYIM